MSVLHKTFCFSILIFFCSFRAVAGVAQGPASRCQFNQGNCPIDQGFVQDYGYGGLTSTGAVVAGAVANPIGGIVNAVVQGGPPNPECVWSVGTSVTTAAGRLWNGAGGDATRAELEAIQCAGENGRAYMLRGSNVQELINTTANLDQIQEELVFLTAVDHIRQFNECQNGLFRSYFDNPVARQEMLDNAWNQFSDIKDVTRPALSEEYTRRSNRASADAVRYCSRENCPTPTVQDIQTIRTSGQNTSRINELREGINALISRIPMANRDSMRAQMENLLMANPLPNRQQFHATFDTEMRKLDQGVQQSRNFIRGITVDDRAEHRLYCIDRGLKQNIYRSGQLETTVQAMGLEDILQNFSTRAANRYGMAGEIITEVALIPTYFVGYGAARLALRAGASSVRAVAQGGRALASVTRGAMLGIEAADYGTAIAAAMNDCDSDEFMARVNGVSCNPENEIGQVYEEASMAQCVTSTLLPFASALAGTTARVVNTSRLNALYAASRPGEEIIVTGSRNAARRGFLSGDQADAAIVSLERKGILLDANTGERVIDPQVATRLSNNERIQLVNEIAGTNLNPGEARSVLRLASQMRREADVTRSQAELVRILRAAGVPDDEVTAAARQIISSNSLGANPRARQNGGAITVGRQDTPTPRATPGPAPTPEPQRITASTSDSVRLSPDEPNAVPIGATTTAPPRLSVDELRELNRRGLADPFRRNESVNGLSADVENAMNLEDLARVYRQWDGVSPNTKNDIFTFLDSVTDFKTRQRYFAILINANNGNPTEALSRLRRLQANPNSKEQILRELDAQISELGSRLNSRPGREFTMEDLARARSALLVERTLIDEGDNLEIVSIFSSNAHNRYYADLGYNPNSARDTFSIDVKPRQGSELRLCRGSFAGRATASNLVGGFFTFCRDAGYIDTPSFGNNLAAPRDTTTRSAARQGTSRISAFGFDDSQTITLGQNGPVRYDGYGQEGSGGVGGAIEFFGDRRGSRVTTDNLQASVRNPVCIRRPNTNCDRIFELQERIRAGDLSAASGPELEQARRDLNRLIEGMLPEARRAVDNIDNFPFETNVDALFDNNPELISALNLRREIELKEAARASVRPGQRFPLDEESLQFSRFTDESRTLSRRFDVNSSDSFEQVKAKLESVLAEARSSSAVRTYNTDNAEISRNFGRLAVTENSADPVGELYGITQRLGRMDDAYNGIRGLASGLSRTINGNPNLTARQIGELRLMINRSLPGNTDFGPMPSRLTSPPTSAITVESAGNGNTAAVSAGGGVNPQGLTSITSAPQVPRVASRAVTGSGANRLGPPPPPAVIIEAIREKNLQHVRLTPEQNAFIDNLVERHDGNAMSEADISALMDNSAAAQNPARPFRSANITSFFATETGPDDVMAAYSRGDLRFITSNGSTRKFQGEINGNRYTIYVCEADTCDAAGITVRRNEVTSISPECGPAIRALPKLSRAKDVLRQSTPITRDSFFVPMPCTN